MGSKAGPFARNCCIQVHWRNFIAPKWGTSKFIAVQSYAYKGDTASGSWRTPSQHWVWDSFSWEGQWGQMCWANRQFTYGRVSWLIQCWELPTHLISWYKYDCRFNRISTVLILFHVEGTETLFYCFYSYQVQVNQWHLAQPKPFPSLFI